MNTQKITALNLLAYVVITLVCYTALAAIFDFPDILRQPMSDRFSLFVQHQNPIVPLYYAFAMTGLLQIVFSLQIFALSPHKSGQTQMALVFGLLAGFTQMMGYIRWVVAIPYLAHQTDLAGLEVIEGLLNAYFGMSIGEHLGTLFLGFWLVLLGMNRQQSPIQAPGLAPLTVVLGVLFCVLAYEPLSEQLAFLSILTIPLWSALATLMLLWSWVLIRKAPVSTPLGVVTWAVASAFWLINVIFAYL